MAATRKGAGARPQRRSKKTEEVSAVWGEQHDTAKEPKASRPVGRPKKSTADTAAKQRGARRAQGDTVFALDIGTRTVIGVIGVMDGDVFRIIDTELVPHKRRVMIDGQVEDIAGVSEIATKVRNALEERNRINLTEVSIAAAGRALKTMRTSMEFDVSDKNTLSADMIRSMEIETIQKAQSENAEKYSGDNIIFYCVGHSIVSYTLDGYKISTLDGHKGDKAVIDLIAAFLPGPVIESLYAVTDSMGLKVKNMTLEPIAAMNAIIPPEIRLINIALCDIGAGTSDIAVAKDGAIIAYAMATVAGDEITEEIVKNFFVDFNMAEKMKKLASESDGSDIEYKDIFGAERKVTKKEFFSKCSAGVDALADVICQTVTEVNGASPAAMFLIGGGSQANGLAGIISRKLGIEGGRVAVGGHEFMKNIDTGGRKLGPEYVTPVGIALTSGTEMSYDFSSVVFNGESVRVFDANGLSVFDLLGAVGYKTSRIMGHSGANLKYFFDGQTVTVKGTPYTPAEITVNGAPAALTTKISQGDTVNVTPCVNGKDARRFIRDILDIKISKINVTFCGEPCKAGMRVYVGDKEVDEDYQIRPLDDIKTKDMRTLGGFLLQYGGDTDTAEVYVNGKLCSEDYILCSGDWIGFEPAKAAQEKAEEAPAPAETPAAETASAASEEPSAAPAPEPEKPREKFINIMFNDEPLKLPEKASGEPYMMLDLFARTDFDVDNFTGQLVIKLNGNDAKFTDEIKDGDVAIVRQEDTGVGH